ESPFDHLELTEGSKPVATPRALDREVPEQPFDDVRAPQVEPLGEDTAFARGGLDDLAAVENDVFLEFGPLELRLDQLDPLHPDREGELSFAAQVDDPHVANHLAPAHSLQSLGRREIGLRGAD